MPVAFVTGGTGFVGFNLIEQLLTENWQVIALHRSTSLAAPPEGEAQSQRALVCKEDMKWEHWNSNQDHCGRYVPF